MNGRGKQLLLAGWACGWALMITAPAPGQDAKTQPVSYRFQVGQTLTYKVEQSTSASETYADGAKTETGTQISLRRHWDVKAVEADGSATLQMRLDKLKMTTRRPDGTTHTYDSDAPGQGEDAKQMAKYFGRVIAQVKVDAQGNVLDVAKSEFGPASKYTADLPFKITLPTAALADGATWTRDYKVTLDPPAGAGEQFEAKQSYAFKGFNSVLAIVSMKTTVTVPEGTTTEQIPLLANQHEGDVYINVKTGRYHASRLRVDRELKDHRGVGSSYRYQSAYAEDLVE